jgi:methionine-rich copper-binding protein CopC
VKKRISAALIMSCFLMLSAAPAFATCIEMQEMNPADGALVEAGKLEQLKLTFNDVPDLSTSTVQVTHIATGEKAVNGELSLVDSTIIVPVRPGIPGAYNVKWSVLGGCGEIADGSAKFSVSKYPGQP